MFVSCFKLMFVFIVQTLALTLKTARLLLILMDVSFTIESARFKQTTYEISSSSNYLSELMFIGLI